MEGKDIATGLMYNPLDLREIFYSNLLLLGFDFEAEEANYRIPLNRDMFAFPNKKAMEIVCHFLFCRLDAQLAFQEFRDCWPIQDKKMEQQFRKSCNSWLSKIYKEEQDSNLPRIVPSLFLSPGGDRFYELMFYFSSFVLRRVMARDHGKYGSVPHVCKKTPRSPNMTKISSKAMIVKSMSERNRFLEEVQYALEVQEHWKSYATLGTKKHRKLSKENRELERRLNPKSHSGYPKEKTTFEEEADALRRTKKLQEVRELWFKLKIFYDSTKEKRAVLNAILEDDEESFSLEGSEIQLQVPDVLTTEYAHYIQMKNIGNTYQAGKLNLLSLIQLCNLALHQLKEKIKQDGIQSYEQFTPLLKNEVHGHAAHLMHAQNLRSVLINDVIPELKKSIDNLKEECYATLDETGQSPIVSLESFNFGLGLLPTTPAPAFATAGHSIHGDSLLPDNLLRKTPRNSDTPDVVEGLTTGVREMVVKGSKQLDETEFDAKHISERSVEGSETPKPFFSKIPKPVPRRLSQTPDGLSKRSTAVVKRMSVSTTKKPKQPKRNGVVRSNVLTTTSGVQSPRNETSVRKSIPGKESSVKRRQDVQLPMNGQRDLTSDYTTPLRTGLKSALKKRPSSARHILAEKIAKAVFEDEPTIRAGNSSSQSSSGNNTPKDLGVADPLGNLGEEPFQPKDLIPRTPFKGDTYTNDDVGNVSENVAEITDVGRCSSKSIRMSSEYGQESPQHPSHLKDDSLFDNLDVFSPRTTSGRSPSPVGRIHGVTSSSPRGGVTNTSPFGVTSTSPLGVTSTSPLGVTSTSPFGVTSTSPLGVTSISPLGVTSTSPLGVTSTSPFVFTSDSGDVCTTYGVTGYASASPLCVTSVSPLCVTSTSPLAVTSTSPFVFTSTSDDACTTHDVTGYTSVSPLDLISASPFLLNSASGEAFTTPRVPPGYTSNTPLRVNSVSQVTGASPFVSTSANGEACTTRDVTGYTNASPRGVTSVSQVTGASPFVFTSASGEAFTTPRVPGYTSTTPHGVNSVCQVPSDTTTNLSTPKEHQLFDFTWKTPGIYPSGLVNSATYRPIESKLINIVPDRNTPFGVTPVRRITATPSARSLNQHLNGSFHESSESTKKHTGSNSSLNSHDKFHSLKSPFVHERLSSVLSHRSGSPPSEPRKLKSDTLLASSLDRTTDENGLWLPTSVPRSTEGRPYSSGEISEPKLFLADSMSNVDRREGFGTPLRESIHGRLLDEEGLTGVFELPGSVTVTSSSIYTATRVSSAASPIAIPRVSSPSEKPAVTNDLILRYQRLIKAQEVKNTDTTLISPSQQPTFGAASTAFATPLISLGNSDPDILFGETPLLEIASPVDLNSNSFRLEEIENVKSRLFFDQSPRLVSVTNSEPRQFSISSPPVGGEKCAHSFSDGRKPEDKTRRPSLGTETEQPWQDQLDLSAEMRNNGSHPLETDTSVKVGLLIDFD